MIAFESISDLSQEVNILWISMLFFPVQEKTVCKLFRFNSWQSSKWMWLFSFQHQCFTCIHKYYTVDEWKAFAAKHPEVLPYVAVSSG